MSSLASEEDVMRLKEELDALKNPSTNSFMSQAYWYWTGGSAAAHEYVIQKSALQKEVTEMAKDGVKEMAAENTEVAGKYLSIMFFVSKHLKDHLEAATRSAIQAFEAAAKDSLNGKLSNLQSLMSSGAATWIFIETHLGVCGTSYTSGLLCSSHSLTRQA